MCAARDARLYDISNIVQCQAKRSWNERVNWGSDSARWRTEQWGHWLQHPKVQERLNDLATGDLHKIDTRISWTGSSPMPSGNILRSLIEASRSDVGMANLNGVFPITYS